MKKEIALIAFAGFLACCGRISISQEHFPAAEQRIFGAADQSPRYSVPLPPDVVELLSREEIVKDALEGERLSPDQIPSSWFLASEVHLANPIEKDLVVTGRCPICGANIVPFWIFQPVKSGHRLVFSGRGLGLSIAHHRTNGYLDLETSSVIAQKLWTDFWRFDGERYELLSNKKSRSKLK